MTGQEKKRQANDWRTFNEKGIKQAKTGLFIQNLCETEHPGDYERAGIFILEFRRDFGAFVRDGPSENMYNMRLKYPGWFLDRDVDVGFETTMMVLFNPHTGVDIPVKDFNEIAKYFTSRGYVGSPIKLTLTQLSSKGHGSL